MVFLYNIWLYVKFIIVPCIVCSNSGRISQEFGKGAVYINQSGTWDGKSSLKTF